MIDRLGWTLLHFVWEGALIALALAFVLPFVRRSARARYALACLALGLLVAAPVATYRALAPAASFAAAPSRLVSTPRQAILAEGTPYQSMLPVLVAVWALGVAVLSVRLGARLYGIERWRRRHARPVGPEWQARVDDLARGMGIQRAIRVLVSDRIAVPSAWGVLRAVIVLPSSLLAGLSTAQVETILLHELAHIRRHDYLVNLVQAVVETLLFYHPAVWWVSGVVRREREHCCDDAVVARLPDPMPYARALLHLEERRHGLPRPTLSAKEGNLMNRIARILTPQPAPTRVSPLASLLAALGVLGAILGGTLQAQAQSKPHSAPKKKPAVAAKPARSAKPLKAVRPVVAAIAPLAPVAPLAAIAPVAPPAPYRWSVSKANGGRLAPLAPPAPAFVQGRRGPGVPPPASAPVRALPMPPLPPPALSGISKGESIAFAAPLPAPAQGGLGGGSFGGGSFRGQSGGLGGGSAQGFGGGGFGGGGFGGGSTAATAPTSPVYGGLSGGGHGRNGPEEVQVESGPPGTVSVDAKEASLVLVMRRMARAAKLSVVIEAGDYREVTMVLTDLPTAEAMGILCRAANATFRKEGNVYYVSPRG